MSNIRFEGFNINQALKEIINSTELNGDEKTVLLAISFYQDNQINGNPSISLSIEEVGKLVKCSKATAGRLMRGLVEKGYLDSIRKGLGYSNIYIFKGWRKWQ